ncbi:hypothetical protein Goklo_029767 [Gossypium klotzschianum]|uniref:Uncharacterized protein n=1 Tax=Gossypium klotzschianum TaxID=34286 RepID=A0A7J8W7T2_9ROSI|nr:hypothetical protein [Gossypium klotzschianum]
MSQLMSMMGDLKKQIGTNILSNTKNNLRRDIKEQVKVTALCSSKVLSISNNTQEENEADEYDLREEIPQGEDLKIEPETIIKSVVEDQESGRPYDAVWKSITIRGKEVHITHREICEFYNAPYYKYDFLNNIDLTCFKDIDMDKIVNYLTNNRGE